MPCLHEQTFDECRVHRAFMRGEPQHGKYSGWTAQIIQHEIDHIAGIVI